MSYLIDVKYEATKYRNSFAKDDLDGPHRAEQDFLAGARCATKFLLHELENVRDNYHENIFPPVTVSELDTPKSVSKDRFVAHTVRYVMDELKRFLIGKK